MTYHKEGLKKQILDCTYELVNLKGYQNISTRMIARELGVSATAIYRHYENIADVMSHVIELASFTFSDYLMMNLDTKVSLHEQLITMGMNYIQFCKELPHLCDLMFMSEYTPVMCQSEMIECFDNEGMKHLVDIVSNLVQASTTQQTVESVLTQLWAFIQGYAFLIRFHQFKIERDLIEKTIIGLVEVK